MHRTTPWAYGYFRHVSSTQGNLSESLALFRGNYALRFGPVALLPFDASLALVDVTGYASGVRPNLPSYLNLTTHAEGIGDIAYFPTLAYVVSEGAQTHTVLAFTPEIALPTGSYDTARLVNIGRHRVTFTPQVAIGQRFLTAFTAELVANVALHSANDEYVFPGAMGELQTAKMEQAMDYAVDLHLGADLSPTFFVPASYFYLRSGQETLPDLDNSVAAGAQAVQSLRFSLGIRLAPTTLVLLQYNQDITTSSDKAAEHVAIERWFGVRLSHAFSTQPEPTPASKVTPAAASRANPHV